MLEVEFLETIEPMKMRCSFYRWTYLTHTNSALLICAGVLRHSLTDVILSARLRRAICLPDGMRSVIKNLVELLTPLRFLCYASLPSHSHAVAPP